MEKISFVIPCYRSEHTIAGVVREIIGTVRTRPEYAYEIILVSDHSPDQVFTEIKRLAGEDINIKGLELARNFGQHAALMAGYRECRGNIVISLDDDGQTPADQLFSLVNKLKEGYDVVYASYPSVQQSRFRIWGSHLNKRMLEILLGKPKNLDVTSYFACRDYIIQEILRYQNAYPYIIGLVFRSTDRIANVPVEHRERKAGQSGYNLKKLFSLWINGFTAFSVKPLRIATVTGLVCALVGFVFGLYTVVHKVLDPATQAGWSSIMAVLLFVGGLILLVLGMIGEYIGRIYICINNSPQYVIRETVNLNGNEDTEQNEGKTERH